MDQTVETPYIYIVRASLAEGDVAEPFNHWYNEVHVPSMLSVPGVRSATRFQEVGRPLTYLALYDIDAPSVFDHPRYAEVRGWGSFERHISWWSKSVLRRDAPDVQFFPGGAS